VIELKKIYNTKVLITNDDGVNSIGLRYLLNIISNFVEKNNVYIITPINQRSGISKAFSFEIKIEEYTIEEYKAIGITGTPSDAVLLGIECFAKNLNYIFSGFNLGPNLGIEDVLSSGTVGAAIEGALHNIPSISLSLVARDWDEYKFLTIEALNKLNVWTHKILYQILKKGLPKNVDLLNINFPLNVVKGVKITKLGKNVYRNIYVRINNDVFKVRKWSLDLYNDDDLETDIQAIRENYISITPIRIDKIFDIDLLKETEEFFSEII